MKTGMIASAWRDEALGPPAAEEPAGPVLSREAIVRWSGVACLYAGTATALACLWSPV